MRPDQAGCYAYRCVGVAARSGQNQPRPSLPVVAVCHGARADVNTKQGHRFMRPRPNWSRV